jgi:hypothetical protein
VTTGVFPVERTVGAFGGETISVLIPFELEYVLILVAAGQVITILVDSVFEELTTGVADRPFVGWTVVFVGMCGPVVTALRCTVVVILALCPEN